MYCIALLLYSPASIQTPSMHHSPSIAHPYTAQYTRNTLQRSPTLHAVPPLYTYTFPSPAPQAPSPIEELPPHIGTIPYTEPSRFPSIPRATTARHGTSCTAQYVWHGIAHRDVVPCVQHSVAQHGTVLYGMAWHTLAQCWMYGMARCTVCTAQHSAPRHGAIWHVTVHHGTALYVQHSVVHHGMVLYGMAQLTVAQRHIDSTVPYRQHGAV